MKQILVPIDFSEYSLNALEAASCIAKVRDMGIRLLHVVEDSYTPYYNMVGISMVEHSTLFTYQQELQDNIRKQLGELAEKMKGRNLSVEYEVILDRAKHGIVKYAEKNNIELIVMGSHGYSDLEEIFIGGTSEKVIRTSPVPVLTVHEIKPGFKIDKIVFASNFEEESVEPVLEKVIEFAEIFMAELNLVRINTSSKLFSNSESRDRAEELCKKFNLTAGAITSYSDRSEEEGIVNYAREVGADLIALATHGRTGLARLFNGSIAEDVVESSTIPVLTYNLTRAKLPRPNASISRERKLKVIQSKKEDPK